MNRSNYLSGLVIVGALAPIIGMNSPAPDTRPRAGFQERRMTTGSVDATTREAFLRALVAARVPGGIVREGNCGGEEAKPQSGLIILSLRESLDSIIRADPQYRWELEQGVINLLPKVGDPDLLKVRIREYRARNVSNVNLALEQLLALPEVRKRTAELHLNQRLKFEGLSTPSRGQSQFKVYCRDVTLRQALNAVVSAHGRAVWEYSERHCDGKNQFAIEFLVQ